MKQCSVARCVGPRLEHFGAGISPTILGIDLFSSVSAKKKSLLLSRN